MWVFVAVCYRSLATTSGIYRVLPSLKTAKTLWTRKKKRWPQQFAPRSGLHLHQPLLLHHLVIPPDSDPLPATTCLSRTLGPPHQREVSNQTQTLWMFCQTSSHSNTGKEAFKKNKGCRICVQPLLCLYHLQPDDLAALGGQWIESAVQSTNLLPGSRQPSVVSARCK